MSLNNRGGVALMVNKVLEMIVDTMRVVGWWSLLGRIKMWSSLDSAVGRHRGRRSLRQPLQG